MAKRDIVIEIMRTAGVEASDLAKLDAWDGEILAVYIGENGTPVVDTGNTAFRVSREVAGVLKARLEESNLPYERTSQGWEWQKLQNEKALKRS